MPDFPEALVEAAWAAADGRATPDQLHLLEADPARWRDVLEHLLDDTEDRLAAVRQLGGPERAQVVADFEAELAQLDAAYDLLFTTDDPVAAIAAADPVGEVRLQASWAKGLIVVWAAGPGVAPESARRAVGPARGHRRARARLEPAPGRDPARRLQGRSAVDPGRRSARLAGRHRWWPRP